MLTQQQPRHVPLCNRAAHAYPPRLLQVREGGVWSRRPLHRRLLRLRATSRQSRGHGIGKGSWWVNPWRWHDILKNDESVSHCAPHRVSHRICQQARPGDSMRHLRSVLFDISHCHGQKAPKIAILGFKKKVRRTDKPSQRCDDASRNYRLKMISNH